jgi:hypothetical protein
MALGSGAAAIPLSILTMAVNGPNRISAVGTIEAFAVVWILIAAVYAACALRIRPLHDDTEYVAHPSHLTRQRASPHLGRTRNQPVGKRSPANVIEQATVPWQAGRSPGVLFAMMHRRSRPE